MTTPIETPPEWCFSSQHVQEQLSYAYVHTISYMAGCKCDRVQDDFGIDAKVSYMTTVGGFQDELGIDLHLQLKSTYCATMTQTAIKYKMELSAYEKLRRITYNRRFLILFVMPRAVSSWITLAERFLVLRHCAYWYHLRGMPETDNKDNITITIPRTQIFDQRALMGEMKRLASRGDGQ